MTVFIQRGDAPLSRRQAIKRGRRYFDAQKAQWEREKGIVEDDPEYREWAEQWITDNLINAENNLFNHQLAAYRAAQARLARYRLADGRPEATEERQARDGQVAPMLDETTGGPVIETVVVRAAIDPLPAQVDQPVIDEETREQTGTEMVANPEIVRDDAERVAAQGVIDGTPSEVREWS